LKHLADDDKKAYQRLIILWDAKTGERLRELQLPNAWIGQLAFAPDGKRLAVGWSMSSDKSGIVLYDVESGKVVKEIGDFQDSVRSIQFAADGEKLLVTEGDVAVLAIEVATGTTVKCWKPPPVRSEWIRDRERVTAALPSPDGKFIAWHIWQLPDYSKLPPGCFPPPAIPEATVLVVSDAVTDKPLYRKAFDRSFLHNLVFCPDSRRFMTGGEKLIAWETATGKELFALDAPSVYRFAFSPDGRLVVTMASNSAVDLWDLKTKKKLHQLCTGFVPMANETLDTSQVFSADGKMLVLATKSTLRVFETRTGKEQEVPGHRSKVTPRFSADGRTLFTSCWETKRSWDLSSAKEPVALTNEARHFWEGTCGNQVLAQSDDGRFIVDEIGIAESVRIRETATGRVLVKLEDDPWWICFGLFSPDATRLMLERYLMERTKDGGIRGGKEPNVLRLYDVTTGKKSGEIKFVDAAGRPAYSPNGRIVAWADRAGAIHLHDAVTGKLVRTLRSLRPLPDIEFHDSNIVFSPDVEYVSVTPRQFQVLLEEKVRATLATRVFHIPSGKEISRFFANPEQGEKAAQLSCAACSPDGRLLAVAEEESGNIRLFEIATGKVRVELNGHRHGVCGLAFSPDGKTLASGGEDNVVLLWDVTGTRTGSAPTNPGDNELATWWADLAADDAKRAGAALAHLTRTPEQSVAYLKERLHPVEALDEKRLARLVAALDSDSFEQREAASRGLAQLGERAEAALRQALEDNPSPEVKHRLRLLLEKLELLTPAPEKLRTLRAVEVLEHTAVPEARRCLEALAEGSPEASQTRAAKAALQHLTKLR
jgi:WD40 repeat protein